jgi:hypothetical protein
MSIVLKFADATGKKYEIRGIWPSTWAAIEWAQKTHRALTGSARKA